MKATNGNGGILKNGRGWKTLLLIALLSLLFPFPASSQTSSCDSLGTEFWLGFPRHKNGLGNVSLKLLITSPYSTSGTVEVPGIAWGPVPFTVTAGGTATVNVNIGAHITAYDAIGNLGVHVTSLQEVTVYGLAASPSASSEAYLALPVDALGTDYRVMAWRNDNDSADHGSEFAIVATADNTTVEITLSAPVPGHSTTPFTVLLNKGQTYQLRNTTNSPGDITGTLIRSLDTSKAIAVFGAHPNATVPNPTTQFANYLVEQMPPLHAWGTEFMTIPLDTRNNGDVFRFLASQNGTVVSRNGSVIANLNAGDVYTTNLMARSYITSNLPILVAQLSNGVGVDDLVPPYADPFMMLVPPTNWFQSLYFTTTPPANFNNHHLNIVAPNSAVGQILVDGVLVPISSFSPIGTSPNHSGTQVTVGAGVHRIESLNNQPFGVTAYGFGYTDGYGFPGGAYIGGAKGSSCPSPTASPTPCAFTQSAACGPIAMEAENYDANVGHGGYAWYLAAGGPSGASGGKSMRAYPTSPDVAVTSNFLTDSPQLDYKIKFACPGTYYVWVRASGDGNDNAVNFSLNQTQFLANNRIQWPAASNWVWANDNNLAAPNNRATLTVTALDIQNQNAGLGYSTLNLWMRKNGARVDQILLTLDPATPTGTLTETARVCPTPTPTPTPTLPACAPGQPGNVWAPQAIGTQVPGTVAVHNGSMVVAGFTGVYSSPNGVNWTLLSNPSFMNNRTGQGMVSFNGKLWVVGGTISGVGVQNDIWSSSNNGSSWTQVTPVGPIFNARQTFGLVVFNNKMWLIGGAGGGIQSDVWSTTDGVNWTLVTSAAAFGPRSVFGTVVFNGQMWVIGGWDGANSKNDAWSSTDGVNWNQETPAAAFSPRSRVSTVVCGNLIWMTGGLDAAGAFLFDVWVSTDGKTWTQTNNAVPYTNIVMQSAVAFNGNVWVVAGGTSGSQNYWTWNSPCCTPLPPTPTPTLAPCPPGQPGNVWLPQAVGTQVPGAVAVHNGNMAVAGFTGVYSSPNGVNWTLLSNPAFMNNRTGQGMVSFNGKLWVVGGTISGVGVQNDIWSSSTNGLTWTQVTPAGPIFNPRQTFGLVVFNNKMWLIGGAGGGIQSDVWSTTDGVNWTQVSSAAAFGPRSVFGTVVFNNKMWVIGGWDGVNVKNDVWSSVDGVNWIQETPGAAFAPRRNLSTVVCGNLIWMTGGMDSVNPFFFDVWVSTDGRTWTQTNSAVPYTSITLQSAVAFNGNVWVVAGGSSGGQNYWTWNSPCCMGAPPAPTATPTPCGTSQNFTQTTSAAAFPARQGHGSVVFDPGTGPKMWVYGGEVPPFAASADVWSSSDGANWTQATASAFTSRSYFGTVVFNNKIWVIGGFGLPGTVGLKNDVWSSADGVNWTQETTAAAFSARQGLSAVVFNNKIWVIGGRDTSITYLNDVWSSSDGINWTLVSNAPFSPREKFTTTVFNNKLWVIGGYSSVAPYMLSDVWSSVDGVNWVQENTAGPFGPRANHTTVVCGGKMYLIAGDAPGTGWPESDDANDIWSSYDGVNWGLEAADAFTPRRNSHTSVVFNGQLWVIGGWEDIFRFNDVWSRPCDVCQSQMAGGGNGPSAMLARPGGDESTPTATPTPNLAEIPLLVTKPNVSHNGEPVKFQVNLRQAGRVELALFNLTGEQVYQVAFQGSYGLNELSWDVRNQAGSNVASGIYVYLLRLEDGTVQRGKVAVLH